MAFPIFVEGDLVTVYSSDGTVEHRDVVDTLKLLSESAREYSGKSLVIVDPGSKYSPSDDDLRQFARMIAHLLSDVFWRIALVAPSDLHFGLGRMAAGLAEVSTPERKHGEFRVFREKREAIDWATAVPNSGEGGEPPHSDAGTDPGKLSKRSP
jgi:hypothetical protein